MEPKLKGILKSLSLSLRHILEGYYDGYDAWHPGDLERKLNGIGVWRDRDPKPTDELPFLSTEDKRTREVVDAYLSYRRQAGVSRSEAVAEFVCESSYTWANRLLALRCMESRGIIDEVIQQKEVYGWRSLQHHRLVQRHPEQASGDDEGLYRVLYNEFTERARDLPELFNPNSLAVALKPSVAALKRCVSLLSGREHVNGGEYASDAVFEASDALGWAYQHWNAEEKDRVFERVRTKKAKIEGSDIIPATQIYTEPYMVKFLVQNSLGAQWICMHPESRLYEHWEYYIRDTDRSPVDAKPVNMISFMDPACGSGHFLLEAFDILYEMYLEEGVLSNPNEICESILNNNLFGLDIDGRAVQIALAALWMRAMQRAPGLKKDVLVGFHEHLVAMNVRLPRGRDHLEEFLRRHPEDRPLRSALEAVFEGLSNVDELGSIIQIEEPVERELMRIKGDYGYQTTLSGPRTREELGVWGRESLLRVREHFSREAEGTDVGASFFSSSAVRGLELYLLLSRRYNIIASNPPYMGRDNFSNKLRQYLNKYYNEVTTDLYSVFIYAFTKMTNTHNGIIAFVSPQSWYTLISFKKLRVKLLPNFKPYILIGLGQRVFDEAPLLYVALSILKPNTSFCIIGDFNNNDDKKSKLLSYCNLKNPNKILWDEINQSESKQLLFNVPEKLRNAIANGPFLKSMAYCKIGLQTGNNDRFVRFIWEIPYKDKFSKRWVKLVKSPGFKKWWVPFTEYIDWEKNGSRIKNSKKSYLRNESFYFKKGVGTSKVSGGRLCGQIWDNGIINDSTILIIPKNKNFLSIIHLLLNSKLANELLRGLSPTLNFNPGYLEKLPLPLNMNIKNAELISNKAINLTMALYEYDITYNPCIIYISNSLKKSIYDIHYKLNNIKKELIDINIESDKIVTKTYDLNINYIVNKNDISPELGLPDLIQYIDNDIIKSKIWFEVMINNCVSTYILLLLGHRWSRQIEEGEPVPEWADRDGVVLLTPGLQEPTLMERIRERVAEDLRAEPSKFEREFEEVMGKSLEEWVKHDFFKQHVSQFKKRPVAWQLESRFLTGSGKGRGRRRTSIRDPAFSCLVYYHKLDSDLLRKIQTQYVNPLKSRYETELRTLEEIGNPSPDQSERSTTLRDMVEELKDFDSRLESVIIGGFDCSKLKEICSDEPLDKWTSADGIRPPPKTSEIFILQEREYNPDINDGVRVNITPLQKSGLLSSDVLVNKDLDQAITDRAEWRADERRWCRDGKLPQPGWWRKT